MLAGLGAVTALGWIWGLQPLFRASLAVELQPAELQPVELQPAELQSAELQSAELQSTEFHPTGIPWISDRASCERSGRQWQNEVCWDAEHDPNF